MNKKKNIIISVCLFVVGIFVGIIGYCVYDNVINKNDVVSNKESTDNQDINNDLSYKIVDTLNDGGIADKTLYVNDKLVTFEDQRNKYSDIDVKRFNNEILIVETSLAASSLYLVNKEAEVIGVFSQENNNYYKDIKKLPTKANYRDTYRMDANNIYIQSDIFGNGGADYLLCNTVTNNSDIVVYEEKFEYLGNDEFSEPVIVKTITREQYMKENNIVCE